MIDKDLETLGYQLAQLRIGRQLKQTELAYEAGVSHRTLQRLEAGEVVRSDGLIKVIRCLARFDEVLVALGDSASPYEMLANMGLSLSELQGAPDGGAGTKGRKKRVRRSAEESSNAPVKKAQVQWPEDQQ